MAFDLNSISTKATHKPPMILLVAKEKMGKSSFCAGSRVENGNIVEWGLNKPIILWTKGEEGVSHIPVAKNNEAISTYEGMMEALGFLATGEHDFETVAIDSLTTFCEIIKNRRSLEYSTVQDGTLT